MSTIKDTPEPTDHKLSRRDLLFTLWIFVMFNYAYADILSLFDVNNLNQLMTGTIDGITLSEPFLFAAAVLMQIPIAMVLLTRVLRYRPARMANIAAASLKTIVVAATLMTPGTSYYWFFSLIEIATTLAIVWIAFRWQPSMHVEMKVSERLQSA